VEDGDALCRYLLEKAQVALVPGSAFGSPECVRLSYAASDETLEEALDRIEKALKEDVYRVNKE
jgi:aspartate/glutamate/aspartate-prephenate aminotransferase